MATQQALDEAYMGCAASIAGLSHARRRKVGAILVGEDGIIAEGVNGTPSGFDNDPEYVVYEAIDGCRYDESILSNCDKVGEDEWRMPRGTPLFKKFVTKPECLHAESNAISKIACSTNSSKGATMYCTLEPCFNCSLLMIRAKIARVVYKEKYVSEHGGDGGTELLRQAGVIVEELQDG
jgi:dCMP deaminase